MAVGSVPLPRDDTSGMGEESMRSRAASRWCGSHLVRMGGLALVALLTLLMTPTHPVHGQATQEVDWPFYGHDLGGMRYVDIDQINPANVSQLQPAWILHTNVSGGELSFESQPIVVGGTMYVTSPHDHVFALDPATGAVKWTYNPEDMPPIEELHVCCGVTNRGVAVGDGKVFLARLDDYLVALDQNTGQEIWKVQVADWRERWTETMAPQYVDGEVLVGNSGGEFQVRGNISAYDAGTGDLLWRFYTSPEPGQPGGDTWAGTSWSDGGATVWTTPEVDPALGLVYVHTGNAAPDVNGKDRAGQNLFTASIVALDLHAGEYRWHFQEVHHDIWDYDAVQPAQLFTVMKDGQEIPAIGHANKSGYYYILDRRNGQPIYPVTETPVPQDPGWQNPWPTQPIPAIDELIPHQIIPGTAPDDVQTGPVFTPPSETPVLVQPGFESGPEWGPGAFSPRTKYAYIPAGGYEPWLYHAMPDVVNSVGSTAVPKVTGVQQWGLFDAIDTTTGRMAWQVRTDFKTVTGTLVAGDLVFFGQSGRGELTAADARTGDVLWKWSSDDQRVGGANGAPAVYTVNGREYVVMAMGGNDREREDSGGKAGAVGDALVAFALPDAGYTGPNVVEAHPMPVEEGELANATEVEAVQSAPPDAVVVDLQTHDFNFYPNEFTVQTGQKVAVHIVNTGIVPTLFAVKLPSGPIKLKEEDKIKPNEDAYIVVTAPDQPGRYEFMSPPQEKFGMVGTMIVVPPGAAAAASGQAASPSAQDPK